jgi:hypothetical protein
MGDLKLNKAEVGERYSDDSGWQSRVLLDVKDNRLEVELGGCAVLVGTVDDAKWLWAALQRVCNAVSA